MAIVILLVSHPLQCLDYRAEHVWLAQAAKWVGAAERPSVSQVVSAQGSIRAQRPASQRAALPTKWLAFSAG